MIVLTLLGRVIQAAGALIMLLAGACTLWVSAGGMSGPGGSPGVLILTVPFGLIGAAPGVGLFLLGGWIARRAKPRPTP